MNTKVLKKKLLSEVGERLVAWGYNPIAKQQAFCRPIENGRVCFHLAFIDHSNDFDVTADVAVRFDHLEDMVNSCNDLLTKKEKQNTFTLGVELGNLSSGIQLRWKVESEEDLHEVTPSIIGTYKTHGEPYLQKFSNMEEAYLLLAGDDRNSRLHAPFHSSRAVRAVGLAKILNKPEIEELIERKKLFLKEKNDFGLQDYLNFIRFIIRQPQN